MATRCWRLKFGHDHPSVDLDNFFVTKALGDDCKVGLSLLGYGKNEAGVLVVGNGWLLHSMRIVVMVFGHILDA